jgi:hypothetical protein
MAVKSEPTDITDLTNGADNHYLEDDDNELEHRRRKSKVGPPMAGFVDQDAVLRNSSIASTTVTPGRSREPGDEWNDRKPQGSPETIRRPNVAQNASYAEDSRGPSNRSLIQFGCRRVPYFRYFGRTAIVPGFKQMVVNLERGSRRKSRGNSFSTTSPGSLVGHGMPHNHTGHHETVLETLEDLPVYDANSSGPVHPLIIQLAETFFVHLGCNYRFLRKERFLRMLKEKRVEPILVDAVCALAARFSDHAIFTNEHDGKVKRSDYGQVFAQRAKAATVDTFPCPSVGAVQACLLMAYERFGADQDSALWMYLGIATRMAVDIGLHRMEGVKYQGERDPWYTRYWSRGGGDGPDGPDNKQDEEETLSPHEQLEVEQERIDTFWAVFVLDRVISSGTGRPVTFRDSDFELSLPPPSIDPVSGWPDPFPPFIEIIHLYGRVSDVLNNRDSKELTEEKLDSLRIMMRDLMAIYHKQDQRLNFDPQHFQAYVNANQGTTFMLMHFWFHALVIVIHQQQPGYREISMSSAKSIADILTFAELIDYKSLVGNPFASQPIYIAACAFLSESVANSSQPPSRETSPTPDFRIDHAKTASLRYGSNHDARPMKHSLLASAASQNYQRCYKSLQQLHQYWGGVGYILNVLDQKAKGIQDCETFTNEEFEALKVARRGSLRRLPRLEHPSSPHVPPIAYSLTGTTNSPNSNLTVLYQANLSTQPGAAGSASITCGPPPPPPPPSSVPVSAATPPGNMIYDPIRQSLPVTPPAFPPSYLQPNFSDVRNEPRTSKTYPLSQSPAVGKSVLKYESPSSGGLDQSSPRCDSKIQLHTVMSRSNQGMHNYTSYNHHGSNHNASYDSMTHDRSSSSTPTDSGMAQQNVVYGHDHSHAHHHVQENNLVHQHNNNSSSNNDHDYEADFAQSGLVSGSYSYMGLNTINDVITFNSQEVTFDVLGLHSDMVPPWFLPGDALSGLVFEGGMMGAGHHMG